MPSTPTRYLIGPSCYIVSVVETRVPPAWRFWAMERAISAERTVHVVDDDAAVRTSLDLLLTSAGLPVVLYEASSDFLSAAPRLSVGCVLLDLRMPGMDGLAVQSRLHEIGSVLPVIVMTGQGDVQTAVKAMKAGAFDIIEKPFDDDALIAAIEAAFSQQSRADETADAVKLIAKLTPREYEVLEALMAGHSNKIIAYDLGISVRTVEVHRARMMERLGVRQLAPAIRLAVMARLASSGTQG